MKFRILTATAASIVFTAAFSLSGLCQELKPVQLPEPKLDPSKSLVQVLKERKTIREYDSASLPDQTLSNLLWAACGITRPDSGRRTSPTAKNWQEIDVYVATTKGMYVYDPKGNALVPVASGDLRSLTYTQPHFKDAPVNFVYVADLGKMDQDVPEANKMLLAAMDTGFLAENVYLCCASEGLSTGYRVSIDKEKLGQALKLRPSQKIMGAQSIGLPKSK